MINEDKKNESISEDSLDSVSAGSSDYMKVRAKVLDVCLGCSAQDKCEYKSKLLQALWDGNQAMIALYTVKMNCANRSKITGIIMKK